MRKVAALILILVGAALGGCSVVGATAGAVGSVAATTVKATGKVTAATIKTTGRVAAAAVTSSGEVTALTLESAASLARAGKVVVVDTSSGVVQELPWRSGMKLYATTESGKLGAAARTAKIFRGSKMVVTNLKSPRAGEVLLQAGDVVELLR
ncbi:hypothetical protein [Oleiharenicola lentus]|uniref:hypothetical protein n=1 Tax=Oleiharenicola lentus TaxID=2508720 RepID=UPI003F669F86